VTNQALQGIADSIGKGNNEKKTPEGVEPSVLFNGDFSFTRVKFIIAQALPVFIALTFISPGRNSLSPKNFARAGATRNSDFV